MRLLVTGSRGQLGRALERTALALGHEFVGCDLPDLDITDADAVRRAVLAARPDAVINCAAFTAVDAAEEDETAALAVNGTAVAHLASAVNEAGAVLVQISTDYVFDGAADHAYREDDPVGPRSAYGRTKLAGETAARAARRNLVVRTAWLFGEGNNFVEAIRGQVEGGATSLRVVADQRGSPTYAGDLAVAVVRLLERGATGTIHAVNSGEATWFEFAEEIVRRLGVSVAVLPITAADAGRPAPRPSRAVLDTSRLRALLGGGLRSWQSALGDYLRLRY